MRWTRRRAALVTTDCESPSSPVCGTPRSLHRLAFAHEHAEPRAVETDVESLNDRLAVEHPIDDYYERSPVPMFPEARLTAIDVSDEYLAVARKNLAGYDVTFLKGEVDKMELDADQFDRVICTEVLEHVVDPDAVLGAITRLLRPTGVAVITVPSDPLIGRIKEVVRRSPAGWVLRDRIEWGGDTYHLHQWTPESFAQLLARHFTITERRSAPADRVPVRACFRCVPRSPRP